MTTTAYTFEARHGYALVDGDGYVVSTWTLTTGPESDEALDEGTKRVVESGDDEACWRYLGKVD